MSAHTIRSVKDHLTLQSTRSDHDAQPQRRPSLAEEYLILQPSAQRLSERANTLAESKKHQPL